MRLAFALEMCRNSYFNGEDVRLDGSIRMAPRRGAVRNPDCMHRPGHANVGAWPDMDSIVR